MRKGNTNNQPVEVFLFAHAHTCPTEKNEQN